MSTPEEQRAAAALAAWVLRDPDAVKALILEAMERAETLDGPAVAALRDMMPDDGISAEVVIMSYCVFAAGFFRGHEIGAG